MRALDELFEVMDWNDEDMSAADLGKRYAYLAPSAAAELAALTERVGRLEASRDAKVEKLKSVLRFVEWHGNIDGWNCCPYCFEIGEHKDDCELAAALQEAQ